MNKISLLFVLSTALLSGCAANYTFEGQKYDSKEKFQAAVRGKYSNAVARVSSLPEPVSQKKLLFGLPTVPVMNEASANWYKASNGSSLSGLSKEMIENLNAANYQGLKVFYEAVAKRNIYNEVQLVDLSSMNGAIAPSSNADVIYMVEPERGSGQWFFSSQRRGKQIFAFDRSSPGIEGKVNAFIQAVQAQAVQD
jgi:hypothetical protein